MIRLNFLLNQVSLTQKTDVTVNKWLLIVILALVAAAVAVITTYLTTRLLLKVALDREGPKFMQKAEKMIAGAMIDPTFLKVLEDSAEALAAKPHELVRIQSDDGQTLLGHWFAHPHAKRVLIAMHGWRSSWNRDFGTIADFWLSHECSVLFVEQRAQNNSGGDYMGFGLIERYDCLDWIHYMVQRVPDLPIYLCGVSMGATTVLMATGLSLPANVHGVMADCGFTSPYAIFKHVANNNLHIGFGVRGAFADMICKEKIRMSTRDYSTVEALHDCTVPVLFAHGTDDHFVPVEMTYENYKACAAPKCLLIVPGADHGMSHYIDKEGYERTVLSFWDKYDA